MQVFSGRGLPEMVLDGSGRTWGAGADVGVESGVTYLVLSIDGWSLVEIGGRPRVIFHW